MTVFKIYFSGRDGNKFWRLVVAESFVSAIRQFVEFYPSLNDRIASIVKLGDAIDHQQTPHHQIPEQSA